ncbi:hypothetical protein EDD76_1239 [Kineothrix alysoides]|uniref:Uncharacterized protein n=1 Tax=Kineothrix alysoides TaxID=1469948 RepID=A0A4R1QK17_9FIRM|nr:hypothetical protein [Kineothrix alysoides]TCL53998.1 hypothetical protein EDD76_1239 [Kineothrix alysoides]
MKKINSNGYGGKVIGAGLTLSFVIPMLSSLVPKNWTELLWLSKISFITGIAVLVLFSIWLMIEFKQDKFWNRHYKDNVSIKLSLPEGIYECQSCGNRQIKKNDKSCNICGIKFKEGGELNAE